MRDYSLEVAAIEWLRYEHSCPLVCMERSPIYGGGVPDVVGVTKKRLVIEIEVKRTLSDFKANEKKTGVIWRRQGLCSEYPLKFYFLVPPKLVDKVKPLLKDGEGLLTLDTKDDGSFDLSPYTKLPKLKCVVGTEAHKQATVLSLKRMVKMVAHQTGTLLKLASIISRGNGEPNDRHV